MNKSVLLLFFSCILAQFACKKTEILAPSSAGLTVLGDANYLELVALESDPKGGFVVGSNSRTFENKQIRVTKYNNNFKEQWDQYVGGPMSNKLFKLHYDRDHNLVAAGLSYGFGADSLPLSQHKHWRPYMAVLNADGDTIWGKGINGLGDFAGAGSGREERITRISQDQEGNYFLVGEMALSPGINSTVGRISSNGALLSAYTTYPNRYGKIDAFLVEENRYSSFGFWDESDTTPAYAGLFKNIKDDTSGSDNYVDLSLESWPFGDSYDVGIVGSIQHEPLNGIWHVDYVFSNTCYRFEINLSTGDISGTYLDFPFEDIQFVKRNDDQSILMTDENGVVYECDNNFQLLHSFGTGWDVKLATKLTNGEFVVGSQRGNQIYLLHLTEDGLTIESE